MEQTLSNHILSQLSSKCRGYPEDVGLSSQRLQRMCDAFEADIDKGIVPAQWCWLLGMGLGISTIK
jgi:hypothetical protein